MQSMLVLALSLFPLAFAAPANNLAVSKRTPGSVFLCNGENWSGDCQNVDFPLGTCKELPPPWRFTLGSAGPDPGAICTIFAQGDSDCTGTGLFILSTPGNADLYDPALGNPGGQALYMQCNECTACT